MTFHKKLKLPSLHPVQYVHGSNFRKEFPWKKKDQPVSNQSPEQEALRVLTGIPKKVKTNYVSIFNLTFHSLYCLPARPRRILPPP